MLCSPLEIHQRLKFIVLGLELNADWVVLSACNAASADGKGEEALSGLARGFFYVGGRSLLVTHWSV